MLVSGIGCLRQQTHGCLYLSYHLKSCVAQKSYTGLYVAEDSLRQARCGELQVRLGRTSADDLWRCHCPPSFPWLPVSPAARLKSHHSRVSERTSKPFNPAPPVQPVPALMDGAFYSLCTYLINPPLCTIDLCPPLPAPPIWTEIQPPPPQSSGSPLSFVRVHTPSNDSPWINRSRGRAFIRQ